MVVLTHLWTPGRPRADRTIFVRGDRLSREDMTALKIAKDMLHLRTEVLVTGLSMEWMRQYRGLADAVNVPFSHPREWERVSSDAHMARQFGLDLCVRTLVTLDNSSVCLCSHLLTLDPKCWTIMRHRGVSPRLFNRFTTTNRRALTETSAVYVDWEIPEEEACAQSFGPTKRIRRRSSTLNHFLDY
jgi:hypothetical protein